MVINFWSEHRNPFTIAMSANPRNSEFNNNFRILSRSIRRLLQAAQSRPLIVGLVRSETTELDLIKDKSQVAAGVGTVVGNVPNVGGLAVLQRARGTAPCPATAGAVFLGGAKILDALQLEKQMAALRETGAVAVNVGRD